MKRSLPFIFSLAFVSGSLSIVAGPRCPIQRRKRRAKAAAAQVAQPVAQPIPALSEPTPSAPAPTAPTPAPAPAAPAPVAMGPAPRLENNKVNLAATADFDAHLNKHPNVVAVFTTTWCGPCKTLKPVLEELIAENKQVLFVYVDGDKFPQLVKKQNIPGFPTVKFFRNGKEVSKTHGGTKAELQGDLTRHFNVSPTASTKPAPSLRQDSGGQASQVVQTPAPAPAPAQPAPTAAPAPAPTPAPAPAKPAETTPSASNKVVLQKTAEFDAHITKHKNVVGVFSTTWCGPCKALKPVLEELVAENKNITFVYVDGDTFPGLVSKYAKVGFPTLKFFKNGKEVGQAVGGQSKAELQSHFQRHFKG